MDTYSVYSYDISFNKVNENWHGIFGCNLLNIIELISMTVSEIYN